MKEREELELILKLIRKYNLPLSPILEYAVNEKMEEYPDMAETIQEDDPDKENNSLLNNDETIITDEGKIESLSHNDEITLSQDYFIENSSNRCSIIDDRGEQVFSSSGKLIILNKIFYGINYTDSLVTMNIIQEKSKGTFSIGRRIISAHCRSPLFEILDKQTYLKQFKAVKYDSDCDEYYVQVDNRWFGSAGFYADINDRIRTKVLNKTSFKKEQIKPIDNIEPSAKINESFSEAAVVEHIYLDSSGDIIKKVSSSQLDGAAVSEKRNGKPWTEKEEDLLKRLFKGSLDTSMIAKIIGRTEVAIKARLAKLGLIEYTYGQEEQESITKEEEKKIDESDFTIENIFNRCAIRNKMGERVFSSEGKLKYINGRLYRLNQKIECFTLKSMQFNGDEWVMGGKKIVAYPQTALYGIMEHAIEHLNEVEDIEDNPVFENCKLKVKGIWYKYNGKLTTDDSDDLKEKSKREKDRLSLLKSPLYAVRKQAILRAMGFFRLPAKIRDITRTISRTAWGSNINEDDVEDMIKTISDVESVDGGYILRKKR